MFSLSGEMKCGKLTWRSSTPSKSLVLRANNGYVALKLKKMAYVSSSGEMKCGKSTWRSSTPSKSLVWRAKNGYIALKLKKMACVSLSVNVAIINPFKVAGFESKERLRSSEIKEDCLRFVLRGSEELYLSIY